MNKRSMSGKRSLLIRPCKGSILAELLVAMTLTAFFSITLFQIVGTAHSFITRWDRGIQLRQTLCAALYFMSSDIRMAGCNPLGTLSFRGLETYSKNHGSEDGFILRMDKRSKNPGSPPDGDVNDPDERIEYRWDLLKGVLRRNGQPMALRIRPPPENKSLFLVEEEAGHTLLTVFLSAGEDDQVVKLTASVFVRNPL